MPASLPESPFSMEVHIEGPDIKASVLFGEQTAEEHAVGLEGLVRFLRGEQDYMIRQDGV